MVELRKRPAPAAAPLPAKKKATATKGKAKKDVSKTAEEPVEEPAAVEAPAESVAKSESAPKPAPAKDGPPKVGDTITLEGFGGEVETNDGEKTSLAKLVGSSKAGVVLFTYPKASTPGCTTQVCLFRDSYEPLTATGYSIYGLSTDSPKANTTFKTKQNLPYALLCDPSATLIGAIGFKKAPKSAVRGVFVVDKQGKVLAAEPGGPAATVDVVKKLVAQNGTGHKEAADTAAEVADSAAKLDGA